MGQETQVTTTNQQSQTPKFNLKFIAPFDSFHEGAPKPIPYVIDGLLTQGGFSALGGKSKYGKSSMSRYEAVCVAKGLPFLGRGSTKGEVILINLEDPINHVDNCLSVLGYDPNEDARIRIVDKLSHSVEENIGALSDALLEMPNVRLVIIDTLPKFIRVKDLNDYMPVLTAVERLHDLARNFPHLHIQGLSHCKKIVTEDPFDGLLGSTALRGEPDTNIAIYGDGRKKIIAAETRTGRTLQPTILTAELAESAGAEVVKGFSLGVPLSQWQEEQTQKGEHKESSTIQERIVAFLQSCDGQSEHREKVLNDVQGSRSAKIAAVETLKSNGVLTQSGVKQSPTDPLVLHLNTTMAAMDGFLKKAAGSVQ
jgi:AAA domain